MTLSARRRLSKEGEKMEITVRKAEMRDIPRLTELLSEVLELHAKIRPDIFISGSTKYTGEECSCTVEKHKAKQG